MKPSAALFVLVAACGSGSGRDSNTPSADVVIGDVDGGTIVGTATPNTKRAGPSKTEARPLSYRECRALAMHIVELEAGDAKVSPDALREANSDPGSFVNCDAPMFSDDIFDCLLATKNLWEARPCLKYGNPLQH